MEALFEIEHKVESSARRNADAIRNKRKLFLEDEYEEIRVILGQQPQLAPSAEKQERIKERKGKRRRRQEERQRNNIKEPEGWSSDDDSHYEDYKISRGNYHRNKNNTKDGNRESS